MSNTIKLKNYLNIFEEYEAGGDITPGHLVKLGSDSKVVVHDSTQLAIPMFAVEDALQGNGIDDAYKSGDPVQVWIPQRGDQAYALLHHDSATVNPGDFLMSAGDGELTKFDAQTLPSSWTGDIEKLKIVAQALEEKASPASSTADRIRVKVRIV